MNKRLAAEFSVLILLGSVPSLSAAQNRAEIESSGKLLIQAIIADSPADRAFLIPRVFSEAALRDIGTERLSGLLDRLKSGYAPLDYHHAEMVTADVGGGIIRRSLHVFIKVQRDGSWKDLQFLLEDGPPFKIARIAFIADVAEPAYLPNGPITSRPTRDWLNGYIDRLTGENGLSGSLLVAKGDDVIFERVFGHEDAGRERPVQVTTRFNLGSGNKMFTAVLIADLVVQKRLAFSDKLTRILPDLALAPQADQVTIHHLLSHTSGVGEYWTEEFTRARPDLRGHADFLPWIRKAGFDFKPGAGCGYSNSNFVLLGLIIEKISGGDFYASVAAKITGPLGLAGTGYDPPGPSGPGTAEALIRDGAGGWNAAPRTTRGGAAGGGFSTARDILKFSRALFGGKLVPRDVLALMTANQTASIDGAFPYGYGILIQKSGGRVSYGHGGITRGVNFSLNYFPDLDLTLVAFSNQDNGAYDDLRKNAIKLITGER